MSKTSYVNYYRKKSFTLLNDAKKNIKRSKKLLQVINDNFKLYNDIIDLYILKKIKTIPTLQKQLNKVEWMKPNLNLKKYVKKNQFVVPEVPKLEKIEPKIEPLYYNQVKLNYDLIENKNYDYRTVGVEISKAKKYAKQNNLKNILYVFEVDYINEDGSIFKGLLSDVIKPKEKTQAEIQAEELYTQKEYGMSVKELNDLLDNGKTQQDEPIKLKSLRFENRLRSSKDQKKFIEIIVQMVCNGSGGEFIPKLWIDEDKNTKRYTSFKTYILPQIITKKDNNQIFRDSDNGTCVYDAFIKYFETKGDYKGKSIYNRLIDNEDEYSKEYTLETLKEIAELCNSSITIKDLITGQDIHINKNTYNLYNIELINTKHNHLDIFLNDFDIKVIKDDEYNEIKNDSSFYVEKMGLLITLDQTYKKEQSEFKIIYNNWKQQNDYDKYFILVDSDEYSLINNYSYILHTFFNKLDIDDSLYKEVDLRKAYYNYSNTELNKFYVGMPSGSFINIICDDKFDFMKLYNNNLIGYFHIKIISSNLDHRLGFNKDDEHVLTSPQIKLLLDKNVEIKFLYASYAPSVHIPFTEDFLNEKYYCKAFGLMMSDNEYINFTVKPLKCDYKYFQTLNTEDIEIYKHNDLVEIKQRNVYNKSYLHFAYFINSYCKTLILDQLLNINLDNVFGVKLDSIVIKKDYDLIIDENIFKIKEGNIESLLSNKENPTLFNNNNKFYDNIYYTNDEDEIPISNNNNNNYDSLLLDIDIDDDDEFNDTIYEQVELNKMNRLPTYIKYVDDSESLFFTGRYNNYFKKIDFEYNYNFKKSFTQDEDFIYKNVVFIGGAGGSGKTTSLLNAFNNKNVCYTTSCWNLIQGQKLKYSDIIGYSLPMMTGGSGLCKCEKVKNNNIKYIIIDEVTLIEEIDIFKIINDYKHCFIFIVGDVDSDGFYYQCSNQNTVIKPDEKMQYIKYNKSYRFNDELKNRLDHLRIQMKHYKDDKNKKIFINKYVQYYFKECYYNIDSIKFNNDDIGISGTNDIVKNENKLTEYFINNGAKPRYYIKTTNKNNGQLRGQEIDGEPTHKNYEMKLFKTIHSFQGLDLNDNNNIIISVKNNFDYNLFYTALSRARRIDQIKIIKY